MKSCKAILCLLGEELKWCKTTSGAEIVNPLMTEPETPEIFQEVIKSSAANNCNETITGNIKIITWYQDISLGQIFLLKALKKRKFQCLGFI